MIKKSIIALSAVAAIATTSVANDDISAQLEALKAQIEKLEAQLKANEQKVQKVEKKVSKQNEKISEVKILANNDNLKFDVDFRTQIDNIQYKHANGAKSKNDDLMTNRLWLGMGYQPNDNTIFKGKLSYLKAYGDSANHSQANTQPGYANFDWVTNENATDNTVKVKEAYWLYMDKDVKVPWTLSVGRRPSTDGLGINLRANMKDNSPLSHTVNVEFDGLSAKFDLDKITGIEGMWWKLCAGRGLTNDSSKNPDVDMIGFIFVPYDNGQYSIHTNYARAFNLIGYTATSIGTYQAAYGTFMASQTATNYNALVYATPQFQDVGDMDLFTLMVKSEGIGNGISNYLDDTTVFASWAMSKTLPNSKGMLGSTESQTGTSVWLGVNAPCPLSPDDARIGVEWNHGSKYWRSVTYGEDTFAGSKISTRGDAWEVYRTAKINNALSWNLRYTLIKYDYTGSNGFFGTEGTPMSWDEVANYRTKGMTADPVKEAQNITASVSYRF